MKRLLPYVHYLKRVALPFTAGIFLGFLNGVMSGFGFPVMIHFVTSKILVGDRSLVAPETLFLYCAMIPAVFLIRGASAFFNTLLMTYSGTRVLEAVRMDVFRKIQKLELSFFSRHKMGDLLMRITGDTVHLQEVLTVLANDAVRKPVTLLSAVGALIYLSFKNKEVIFILFCLASVPVCVLTIRKIGKRLLHRTRQSRRLAGSLTNMLTENLLAPKEVRAFCLQTFQVQKFLSLIQRGITLQMKTVRYSSFLSPVIEIISSIGISLTLFVAFQKGLGLEVFIPLVSALYFSYNPIKSLGIIHNKFKRGQASLERLEEVLNAPITVRDPETPISVKRLRGDVRFERVSFAYTDVPALKEIAFSVKAGTTVALVGASGAGKTTIANLLLRFYDVSSGRIILDGIDIKAMRKADLRRNIAFVPQDPFLFNDTIYNNIRYGNLDATEEHIYAAARNAYADDFIRQTPKGYHSYVGERGGAVSGGQKQRLAIARAFLRDAPILILDEATSALDAKSESIIQRAIEKLVQDRTVFIIAHRFSTIRLADRILVLHKGRLAAEGTHTDLYAHCDIYKKLYNTQKFD